MFFNFLTRLKIAVVFSIYSINRQVNSFFFKMAITSYRKRKTRLSNYLLFNDDDNGSDIDFKIEPATRRNKKQCRKVLFCKQKQIQFIKTTS